MPVYDIELVEDETCRQFSSRLAAKNPNVAKRAARKEAQSERFDADGQPLEGGAPLRCLVCVKLSDAEGLEWLRSRPRPPVSEVEAGPMVADPGDAPVQTRKKRVERDKGAQYQPALLRAALAKSDRGGIQDDTEWVYQNLGVPWKAIDAETVPSPGAVTLLAEAKQDKRWFLEKYHARLLPTKAKIDAGGWLEADDGQVAEMAALIREEMAAEDVEV